MTNPFALVGEAVVHAEGWALQAEASMTKDRVHDRARVCDQKGCNHKVIRRAVHVVIEHRIHILPLSIHNLCGHGERTCYEKQEGEE